MRIQIGIFAIGTIFATSAHALRAPSEPPPCACTGTSNTGTLPAGQTDPKQEQECSCPVGGSHQHHHHGAIQIAVGVSLFNFADCEQKVKALQAVPVAGPWTRGEREPQLSADDYCRRLFPDTRPICEPSGPNNLLCTNGNQAHWDGNSCRYTCAFENGSCHRGNQFMETEIACAQGYHRVDDEATCSARCEPDLQCPMYYLQCQKGFHSETKPGTCQQSCVPDVGSTTCAPSEPPAIHCSLGSHLQRDPVTCGWACFTNVYGND